MNCRPSAASSDRPGAPAVVVLGSTVADVQKALGAANLLPKGVYYELGGLYQQQQIAFKGLMTVFGAAVALVFGLLLFLYERFRIALAVLAMPLIYALLTIGVVVQAVRVWRGRFWRVGRRIHYTLVALASVALTWFFYQWNVLGWHFG